MAQSKLELAVGTGKWDAGLKKAQQALNSFTQAQGGLQQALDKDNGKMQSFIQMMGKMDSTASTSKGQMNDYKRVLEQLTADYNKMSDAQKKSIGTDYLQTIDALKQKFQAAKQQVDEFNRSLGNTSEIKLPEGGSGLFGGGKLDGMLQVFGGNLMTKAADFAASLASEIGSCVQQGIELARQGEGVRIAFERLGRGDILDGLREATHGTVTDIELMKAAVKFNDFKLPVEELGTMLAFAQQKAKDTGQSVDYMVDSIVTGLGRKSLMILDNLGMSAAEIKDKMKDTGDMTKAVGAIIREQMAKAGDYVETAADRAAQANVSLQNKMEELGRKFAPIEEASNQLWTSMKIGILDIIGGPLARLLNGLTEAGRLKNALNDINGDGSGNKETKVEKALRMLREYSGGGNGAEGKRDLYNRQMALYSANEEKDWRNYNNLQIAEDVYRKKMYQRGQNAGDQAVLDSFAKQIENARNRALAWQQMAAQYEKGAQGILNPSASSPEPTNVDGGKKKAKDLDELQKIQAKIADLTKEAYTADESRLQAIQKEIAGLQEQEKKLISIRDLVTGKGGDNAPVFSEKELSAFSTNTPDLRGNNGKAQDKFDIGTAAFATSGTSQADISAYISSIKSAIQDANLGSDLYISLTEKLNDASTLSSVLQQALASGVEGADLAPIAEELKAKLMEGDITDEAWQEFIDKLNELIENEDLKLTFNVDTKSVDTAAKTMAKQAAQTQKAWSLAAQSVSNIGTALNSIEDPAAKAAGTVMQAVASIALGFAMASSNANTAGTGWGWLAWLAAGTAALATTISTVHSLTGFSEGGIVGGNSYSGDNVGPVMLDAGEVVLNRAQTRNLASQLEGGGLSDIHLETRVDAEELIIMLNNNGLRRGYGRFIND